MPTLRLLPLALALGLPFTATAAEPVRVTATDLHLEALRPATMTYLVYFHGAAGSGAKRALLATSSVRRERVEGTDAWVIDQSWEDENGIVHTAHTVHAAKDVATLAQTSHWSRAGRAFTTRITPASGQGESEGELPEAARANTQAGFAAMREGWWMNWHSDLTLLPLLPYEKGGTLRIRLFDVGMAAPMDVDYVVRGERALAGADGKPRACWLVETESGKPGSGNVQRFWIDKAQRVVVKEEDIFNGSYRSKVLLAAPATIEFPLPAAAG
ncbi:hypothetical protein [Thermomonas haemolytica]|uniref:DUF3108 domain-containing protein n=1 Tax=Thermomonas haemolytica TaxID=141949 RepID=A0A4R3N637_9GAMM|nr:hypothetical protein [Thermomonas haemolytica]TCT22553.1 hypothetical protein EDC34_107105 [Thermomonas haemolytica]TNY29203.1 hypothetical protein BV505_05950 [Thermomonas haemolytica]